MKPFVVSSRAVVIRVRNYRLVIEDYFNRCSHEFAPHELPFNFLVVANSTGNLSLSAIKFLITHKIPVLFLGWNGTPNGALIPPSPLAGVLQIAQLRAYLDPQKRRYIAGKFLEEKFAKTVQLLRHLHRYYPAVETIQVEREVERPVPNRPKDLHGTLMAKEARVAVAYFKELSKIVSELVPEFGFKTRGQSSTSNNMSASDPFNVCLNLTYGVLEFWVRAAVNQAGFNETVGFLHEAQPGALPLVYDCMEPSRWLADYSLIHLLEKGSLDKSDFTVTPELRLRMRPTAIRRIADELAANFGRKIPSGAARRKYDTVLGDDARKLANFVTGAFGSFDLRTPFVVGEMQTDARLRERLLGLTIEERKRLGIPKTTYFYIRKNIQAGESFRLYRPVRQRLVENTRNRKLTTVPSLEGEDHKN